MQLTKDIWHMIYQYDSTWKDHYAKVITELNNFTCQGKWWIIYSHKNSVKFTSKDDSSITVRQYFLLQICLSKICNTKRRFIAIHNLT